MSKFYNNLKTGMLMAILTAIVLLCGAPFGQQGIIIALVMAGVMNFVGYFFSAQIALSMMSAKEVGPDHELYQITEQLARRANMPMPKVYVSPQEAPNAFATGRSPKHAAVCATEGLLRVLNRDEVAGVMAHELAHVKNYDTLIQTLAATAGGAISSIGYMFMFAGGSQNSDEEEGNPLAPLFGLVVLIVGPIAAMLIQMAISRSREYVADTTGAEICGDPMYLATALEKIHLLANRVPMQVNPAYNSMFIAEPKAFGGQGGLAGMFQTHPALEKRLKNLIGRERTGMFIYQ